MSAAGEPDEHGIAGALPGIDAEDHQPERGAGQEAGAPGHRQQIDMHAKDQIGSNPEKRPERGGKISAEPAARFAAPVDLRRWLLPGGTQDARNRYDLGYAGIGHQAIDHIAIVARDAAQPPEGIVQEDQDLHRAKRCLTIEAASSAKSRQNQGCV